MSAGGSNQRRRQQPATDGGRHPANATALHSKFMTPGVAISLTRSGLRWRSDRDLPAGRRKSFDQAMSFPGSGGFVLCWQENTEVEVLGRRLATALGRAGLRHRPSCKPHVTLLYDSRQITKHAIEPIRCEANLLSSCTRSSTTLVRSSDQVSLWRFVRNVIIVRTRILLILKTFLSSWSSPKVGISAI